MKKELALQASYILTDIEQVEELMSKIFSIKNDYMTENQYEQFFSILNLEKAKLEQKLEDL